MAGFFDKLRQGLSKTGSGIAAIFTGSGIDDEFYEELEEALIMADVGMATTDKLLSGLRDAVAEKKIKERSEARKELISLLADLDAARKAISRRGEQGRDNGGRRERRGEDHLVG